MSAVLNSADIFAAGGVLSQDVFEIRTDGNIGNGLQFLLMDQDAWSTANGDADVVDANTFHFYNDGLSRIEFEANGTGSDLQFYIECGANQEVWYGLQEGATHLWSIGVDTDATKDVKFVKGFGLAGTQVLRVRYSDEDVVVKKSLNVGEENPTAVLNALRAFNNEAGIAPVLIENSHGDGSGLLIKAGNGVYNNSLYYLIDARTTGGTSVFKVCHDGSVGIKESSPDYALDVNGPIGFRPGASVAPVDNGDVVFELTSNTTLTFKAKGSDGTVRSGTVTLS